MTGDEKSRPVLIHPRFITGTLMTVVDLRSDTVTRPTPAMREAMARAEVGDDVYGEDPTVRRLEEKVAALLGKEAAVFVSSGTMANQIGLSLLAEPGTEVIIEEGAHVLNYEAGAASAFWGITLRPLPGEFGRFTPDQIRPYLLSLQSPDEHVPPLRAISIENTHNRAGGAVWSLDEIDAVYEIARTNGLAVHLDGARLWNAARALDVPLDRLSAGAETVSVCFSKGLGAPVGSALASTRERIADARYRRKRLGGGMRQAGIIAAGALHAVEHHFDRLIEDHHRARRLGEAIAKYPGVRVFPVDTNMVIADFEGTTRSASEIESALAEKGLLVFEVGKERIRMVLHLDVDDAGLEHAIRAVDAVLEGTV